MSIVENHSENIVINDSTNTLVNTTSKDNTLNEKQLTIIFCLPGKSFSNHFLISWSEILVFCLKNNIRPIISCHKSNNVYYVRNMCLGGDFSLGIEQKPFNGKVDYDYIMWIDSDQVFRVNNLISLLNHNKDVVSGLYIMENNYEYPVVRKLDIEYLMKYKNFEFLNKNTLTDWIKENIIGTPEEKEDPSGNKYLDLSGCTIPLMEAEYTGLGWTLMKKGVLEKLQYPWFNQLPIELKNDKDEVVIRDFTSEDVSLFYKLKQHNIKCYVDVTNMVGHEKTVIL